MHSSPLPVRPLRGLLVWLLGVAMLPASAPSAGQEMVDFGREIQPILAKRCYKCHGPDEAEGGLQLNERQAAFAELESGEFAIVPGSVASSALVQRITTDDEFERMPPEGASLADQEVALLSRWIEQGAKWQAHWAFQPPKRPAVPEVRNKSWVRNPIDAFILHRLEAAGLQPAPPADKVALLRRVYYDLVGLPPKPEDVDALLADDSPQAFEKVVDRLLKSSHYGEKWARDWLDLVRYAETNGYERDNPKENVWKYRDYVIDAFNNDKPYDRFVTEQLAGDELEDATAETIIATGYYRLGVWDDEPVDRLQAYYDGLDDVVVTTGQTFLGLTIGCARCHEHKIDPIPQADYYRMMAFFHNLKHGNTQQSIATSTEQQLREEKVRQHGAKLKALQQKIKVIEQRISETFSNPEKEDARDRRVREQLLRQKRKQALSAEELRAYLELQDEQKRLQRSKIPPLNSALAAMEKGNRAPETFVLLRGSAHARGDLVQPGFPQAVSSGTVELPEQGRNGSSRRRLALARWLVSPENPLTARVIVNRVWQHHCGRGIVRSTSDFGYQGTPPTHPELLDWLATELIARDWQLKSLHKLIIMSAAYQMSSQADATALARDPTNDLFWRFNMRRLTAEEIRDSILAVGGTLNIKMYGPAVFPPLPEEVLATASRPKNAWGKSPLEEAARRSVYVHVKRSLRPPMMANFDAPDTDTSCAARMTTTVPTQALGMLNGRFMNEQAQILADRIRRERPENLRQQVAWAIRLTTGRAPPPDEIDGDVKFVQQLQAAEKLSPQEALRHYCLMVLNTNEFVYLD